MNQNHTKNRSTAANAANARITVPPERYLVTTLAPSLRFFRSGPVNGVTLLDRITQLIIPSSSQKKVMNIRASVLLLNRYTTIKVVKIKNALYRKTRGFSVINVHACEKDLRDSVSMMKYKMQHPAACSGRESRLQIFKAFAQPGLSSFGSLAFFLRHSLNLQKPFFILSLNFFIYFESCSNLVRTCSIICS